MDLQHQIREWLDKLRAGTLVEDDLQQMLDRLTAQPEGQRQKLLYLQAHKAGVDADVIGMSIVENGQILEGPEDPDEWPYKTVLEAVNDGWRIIKFPELALMLQDQETYGLGCDFVLEKYS